MTADQRLADLEREFRNAAARAAYADERQKAQAYRYAAWLVRQAMKEDDA